MGTSVFISHSHHDSRRIARLKRDLEAHGIEVVLGEVPVGDNLLSGISKLLKQCDYVAVWFTKHAVKSHWVWEESSTAYIDQLNSGTIRVLPLLGGNCKIPPPLDKLKFADFRDYKLGLGQLLARIQGPAAAGATTAPWIRAPTTFQLWIKPLCIIIGLLLFLGLIVYSYFVMGQTKQAETLLDEVAREVTPGFPAFMCRDPSPPDQVPDKIEQKLENAGSLITAVPTIVGAHLKGSLLIARAVYAREKEEKCKDDDGMDCWKFHAEFDGFRERSTRVLSGDDVLVILRELETHIDRIGDLGKAAVETKTDPCTTKESAEGWTTENEASDSVFKTLMTNRRSIPLNLLGCLWMLRAEQMYWRAGVCGDADLPRRAQALVSFTRAAELAESPSGIVEAMAEVLRARDEARLPLTEAQRREMEKLVLERLSQDARLFGDTEMMRGRTPSIRRAVEALLADDPARLRWRVDLYMALVDRGSAKPRDIDHLAELLILAGRPEEAARRLSAAAREVDASSTDYVRQLLIGKAYCLSLGFEESLQFVRTAALRVNQESALGERWGYASVLAPICEAAAGKLSSDQMRQILRNLPADHVAKEVCEIREIAPALLAAVRRRGASWLTDGLAKICSDQEPALPAAAS